MAMKTLEDNCAAKRHSGVAATEQRRLESVISNRAQSEFPPSGPGLGTIISTTLDCSFRYECIARSGAKPCEHDYLIACLPRTSN